MDVEMQTVIGYLGIIAVLCVLCFCAGAFFGAFFSMASLLIRVPVVESIMVKIARQRLRQAEEELDDAEDDDEPDLEDLASPGHFIRSPDGKERFVPRSDTD